MMCEIFLSSSEAGVTLNATSLVFAANNNDATGWNVPRPVTVSVARDPNAVKEKAVLEHRWEAVAGPVVKTVNRECWRDPYTESDDFQDQFGGHRRPKQ